jgi:crotonobetainyl-CoA:carnitine CoA-transferase CaiB-like acyl-CoA transferase
MHDFDIPGFPLKFSQFPEELPLQAPLLGEHNGDILNNYLGYSNDRIAKLQADGVLYSQNT